MKAISPVCALALITVASLSTCKESGTKEPVKVVVQMEARPRPTPAQGELPPPLEPTRVQRLRAEMTAEELRTVREELAPMYSKNRWSSEEQDSYLKSCEAAKKDDASINRRLCECTMEVLMNKFAAAKEYAQHLADHGNKSDDADLSTMTGLCTAAYGD